MIKDAVWVAGRLHGESMPQNRTDRAKKCHTSQVRFQQVKGSEKVTNSVSAAQALPTFVIWGPALGLCLRYRGMDICSPATEGKPAEMQVRPWSVGSCGAGSP